MIIIITNSRIPPSPPKFLLKVLHSSASEYHDPTSSFVIPTRASSTGWLVDWFRPFSTRLLFLKIWTCIPPPSFLPKTYGFFCLSRKEFQVNGVDFMEFFSRVKKSGVIMAMGGGGNRNCTRPPLPRPSPLKGGSKLPVKVNLILP